MRMLIIVMFILLLLPISSQAAYWDAEMTASDFVTSSQTSWGTLPCGGTTPCGMTIDTATKFSGAGSLRYNYTDQCQTQLNCGGFTDRYFPAATGHYGRVYMYLSSDYTWSVINGHSKMFGVRGTGNSKIWFDFFYNLNLIVQAENAPVTGSTTHIGLGFTFPRQQWVCMEWHFIASTPGVPNGTIEAWFNGNQTISRTNVQWSGADSPGQWNFIRLYRQSGSGSVYFDRMAVSNTRIGCVGTLPPDDTTNPNPPTGLTAQ